MGKKAKKKSEQADEEETSEKKSQPPRKRGRPRKTAHENTGAEGTDGSRDSEAKRGRSHEEEEKEKDKGREESSFSGGIETSAVVDDGEDKKKETLKRKGRRKGHPRKSS